MHKLNAKLLDLKQDKEKVIAIAKNINDQREHSQVLNVELSAQALEKVSFIKSKLDVENDIQIHFSLRELPSSNFAVAEDISFISINGIEVSLIEIDQEYDELKLNKIDRIEEIERANKAQNKLMLFVGSWIALFVIGLIIYSYIS